MLVVRSSAAGTAASFNAGSYGRTGTGCRSLAGTERTATPFVIDAYYHRYSHCRPTSPFARGLVLLLLASRIVLSSIQPCSHSQPTISLFCVLMNLMVSQEEVLSV